MAQSTIATMQAEIKQALDESFSSLWSVLTKYSVMCFEHCNDNNHSPDLVHFMAGELRQHGNGGGIYLKTYIFAARLITARELKWDTTKKAYTSVFHKENWATIKAEEFKYLAQIKENGLGSLKPKSTTKQKNKVTQGEWAILCKDLGEELQAIAAIDADDKELVALKEQLATLLTTVKKKHQSLLRTQAEGSGLTGILRPQGEEEKEAEAA